MSVAVESAKAQRLDGVRILVVMPSIPLHGMERKTIQIMSEMREEGAEICFITRREHGERIRSEVERIGCSWIDATFEKLLNISRNPREMGSVLGAWFRTSVEVKRICREYRPTHLFITNFTYFLYCWPLLPFVRSRVIFSLPVPPDTTLPGYKQALSNFIWRFGVSLFCDDVVCNSGFTRSKVEQVGVKVAKVRTIYATAPERAGMLRSDAPTVDRAKINVVYLGRICEDKGVGVLVEAATRIVAERNDVNFYLAGDYSWENPFADELMRQLDQQGLSDRIHFVGEIEDVPGLIGKCQLHVCPSLCEEALSLSVLEAKRGGIPSVAFPSGGLPEAVEHMRDGYLCRAKTVGELAGGITYFLDRPDALREAGFAARESQARFSKEKNIAAWTDVFRTRKTGGRKGPQV